MKVLEVIKNNSKFVITKNGNILAINNGDKIQLGKNSKLTEDNILNMEVKKVQNTKDFNQDYHVNYSLIRV